MNFKHFTFEGYSVFKKCLLLLSLASLLGLAQTPVQKFGQLQVSGNKIVDKNNNAAQLRGMSLFWSQWIGKYYTYNTVKWLRDDWCTNVIRAAMAVDNEGYATHPDQEKEKVFTVIDAAINLGIYVIVDFHVHDAHLYKTEAKTFFTEVAQKYGNHPNIIYEIWNEPVDVSWSGVIKPYHNEVVATIRQFDPDNIIVCGTRSWSQRVDEAADDPVTGTNIAYTLHYYANSHGQDLRNFCSHALSKNKAVFVTEFGTCSADGGGNVNTGESNAWFSYLDQNKISYCNWSIADKVEAASALQPNASINGNWTTNDLTTSGTFIRNHYKSRCDFTIPKNVSTSLTAPLNNTTYALGTPVTITATAQTLAGTITKVEFYLDDVLIGSATQAPYTITLPSLGIGKHKLFAKAYSSENDNALSNPINVEVETPLFKTNTSPLIDGTIDAVWTTAGIPEIAINRGVSGTILGAEDLSGSFKALWDNEYLYLLANVSDESKTNDSPEVYNDDGIEVFIDINNDKASTYGANDVQYTFGWDDGIVIATNPSGRATTGITYTMVTKTGGYIFEAKIPWATLKGAPSVGQKVGFDIHINDDDASGGRDAKLAWTSTSDDTWQDPSLLGTVVLQDLVPCTKPSGGALTEIDRVCTGNIVTLEVKGATDATSYEWTLPAGFSILTDDTSSTLRATATQALTGNISVMPKNSCGKGTAVLLPILVHPTPDALIKNPPKDTTLCGGTSHMLSTTAASQHAYVWTKDDGTVVGRSSSISITEAGIYKVQVTDTQSNCTATSAGVNIDFHAAPTVILPPPQQEGPFQAPAALTLEAQTTGNAIAKVRFYQGSLMIAEVTSAPYQANINDLAPGDYTFMAVAVSQAGCTDTAFTTVGVVTAVGDYSFEETISVFPNPYEEQVTIAMAGGFRYSLHNVNGSELKRGEGFDKISLGTELSNGIYILKLSKGDVIKILRIEKK